LHEYIFGFEEDDFAIFSWALIHRGSEYLQISGREGEANWRKFTASNSTLCKEAYPIDSTYTSKKSTDHSEHKSVGKIAHSFFEYVTPRITRAKPSSRW